LGKKNTKGEWGLRNGFFDSWTEHRKEAELVTQWGHEAPGRSSPLVQNCPLEKIRKRKKKKATIQ
jgi:hypothetical protein